MKKCTFSPIVCFLLLTVANAQETFFNSSSYAHSNGKDARLYSVDISEHITSVVIELTATRNQSFMQILVGNNPVIVADEYENDYFLGIMTEGDSPYEKIPCGANVGPRNVKKGQVFYITLLFLGHIPPGCRNFSLIDEGNCHGFGFRNYTLNNPDTHPKSTYFFESELKIVIDETNDGIVGIYERTGGNHPRYKLACIKQNGEYKLVYISGGDTWWHTGDIKANLTETASLGFFKCEWYMADKHLDDAWYVSFNGKTMETIDGDGEKDIYIKMYPSVSTNIQQSQSWSGTGWALGNGYVITNNHVTEGARTITINGVNGDLNTGYSAEVVATDKTNDIAVLKITDYRFKGFGAIPYAVSSRIADKGEGIFVLGYPMTQVLGNEVKYTAGEINSRTGFLGDVATYQISAPVTHGNSGGPMFDNKGNVIGIVNSGITDKEIAENVGYAIKVSYLKILIESAGLNITLPQNNTISNLSKQEKIKKVEKFVYYIECSK